MKFNKIRQLTEGPKQLIKALRHSDHLELNENETMIRRKETFVEPTQHHVDKRTIYVVTKSLSFKPDLGPKV